MSTRVVAIDGPGGAGKSVLAESLAVELDVAKIVHTDEFASWDDPLDWWPRLLAQVLEPLGRNESSRYQRYDWDEQRLSDWRDVEPAPFLILEGVSSSRESFSRYLAYRIWVETPRSERLRRGLERDGPDRLELWNSWMQSEDAYIARENPMQRADCVIDGMRPLDG